MPQVLLGEEVGHERRAVGQALQRGRQVTCVAEVVQTCSTYTTTTTGLGRCYCYLQEMR